MKTGLTWITGAFTQIGSLYGSGVDKKTAGFSRSSLKPLRAIPTTCEQCPAKCGIIAYLDGEKLVQILGNTAHPNNQGGICAKGIAGINLVNDPERLVYPIKRKGPRGNNEWTQITWDEAYSKLSARIKAMIRDNKLSELCVDMGQSDPLLERFIAAVGTPNIIDRPSMKNLNRDRALYSMLQSPFLIEDIGRSRTILNFGANPYANHDQFIGMARRLVNARVENGTRLITFDVRLSETAAKSDEWHPIKPGTDAIIALAMAHVILHKNLADRVFIDHQTNYSISQAKQHLSKYTPELAERESGMRAADIERLALEFAKNKPSVAIIGGGIYDHENGIQNIRSVYLLNWLTGNLEKEGGLFSPRHIESFDSNPIHTGQAEQKSSHPLQTIKDISLTNMKIDTYLAFLSNPAYSDPGCKSTTRFLQDEGRVPFLVVMDTHLTETAMIADMVLPAATYLESWGISSPPSFDKDPVFNLKQPVVSLLDPAQALRSPAYDVGKLLEPSFEPKGEAKEIGNVCLELSRWIGSPVKGYLPFENTKEYCAEVVSQIPGLGATEGFNRLKEKGLWIDKKPERSDTSVTPRVEILSNTFNKIKGSALPGYQPISFHKDLKTDEFILTPFKSNLRAKGTSNSKWIREIHHENPLWINKEAAKKLGLRKGSRVRVISSVGTLITRVLITDRIHPTSVALAEGFGHTATGNVARAKRFQSIDKDTRLIWWSKKGNGVNPCEIIERRVDPLGGGLGLKDTVVRVEKMT